MKDYPFDSEVLFEFSQSTPYSELPAFYEQLKSDLDLLKNKLNFPALSDDIGELIRLLIHLNKSKTVFEMGSGFGHSAFWYICDELSTIEKIVLTEKRDDLKTYFESFNWGQWAKNKIEYHQEDAFKVLDKQTKFDFILIDGVKADYMKFLEYADQFLNNDGIILIDNSWWRGSFLDKNLRETKQSAKNIFNLHQNIKNKNKYLKTFLPFKDGVSILIKK